MSAINGGAIQPGQRSIDNIEALIDEVDGDLAVAGSLSHGLVWDDVQGQVVQGTGVSALTLEAYSDTPLSMYFWRHDQSDALTFAYQMPHAWKVGTQVKPHLHAIPMSDPATTEAVQFVGQYAWLKVGAAAPSNTGFTAFTATHSVYPGAGGKEAIIPLCSTTPTTDYVESSILLLHVYRAGQLTSDTYTTGKASGTAAANLGLISFDAHYQREKLGTAAEIPT